MTVGVPTLLGEGNGGGSSVETRSVEYLDLEGKEEERKAKKKKRFFCFFV